MKDVGRRRALLEALRQDRRIKVLGGFTGISDGVTAIADPGPGKVLVINVDQAGMGEMRAWALLRSLLGRDVLIVALTQGENLDVLENLLGIGVAGLHPPGIEPSALRRAVRSVARGQTDFDRALADRARLSLMTDISGELIQIGGVSLDLESGEVARMGKPINLSVLELRVRTHLARNRWRPVSCGELLEAAWGHSQEAGGTSDQVKSCIKRIRRKIEDDPSHPRLGYTLPE